MSIPAHTHEGISGTGNVIERGVDSIKNVGSSVSKSSNDLLGFSIKCAKYATYLMNTYTWLIFGLIFFLILKFYLVQWEKKDINYDNLQRDLDVFNPRINGVSEDEYNVNAPIRDYFVMSSYNSCVGGDTWQDWVDINILEKLIKMGVRGFDFELYLKDDKCVVSVGPQAEHDQFVLKGTYNYIEFKDVLKKLDSFGFGTVENASDPIFVNLRIKSNNPAIYDKIAQAILDSNNIRPEHRIQWDKNRDLMKYTVFSNLYKKYKYKKYESKNIINEPLKLIKEKIVFICNDIPTNSFYGEWNDTYNGVGKNKYMFMACINMSDVIGSSLPLTNFKVVFSHNIKNLRRDLKRIMAVSVPDFSTTGKNPKWEKHAEAGCQLIYMNFSNRDGELISYIKNWDLAKRALILKPNHMRFFPIPIKTPVPQKKKLSFGERKCNPEVAFMQCI